MSETTLETFRVCFILVNNFSCLLERYTYFPNVFADVIS